MRFLNAMLIFSCCNLCLAEEIVRPRVSMDSAPLGDVRALVDNIAASCEKGDLEGFLGCFSKTKRSTMRKDSRKMFSEHKVRMTVLSVETLLVEDDQTHVRLEYIWDVDMLPKKRITSNAVIKPEDGSLKVHSEKILQSRTNNEEDRSLEVNFAAPNDGLPADIGRHNKGKCANGRCGIIRIAPEMIPAKPVAGDGLPADIGRHEIGRCANGQCGIAKPAPEFAPPMPEFAPALDDGLPAGIGRRDCANGRCSLPAK